MPDIDIFRSKFSNAVTVTARRRLNCCDSVNFLYSELQEYIRYNGGEVTNTNFVLDLGLTPAQLSFLNAINQINNQVRKAYTILRKCNNKSCCSETAFAILILAAEAVDQVFALLFLVSFSDQFIQLAFSLILQQFSENVKFIVSVSSCDDSSTGNVSTIVTNSDQLAPPADKNLTPTRESQIIDCCTALVLNFAQYHFRAFIPFRIIFNGEDPIPVPENESRNLFEFEQEKIFSGLLQVYFKQLLCCDPKCCQGTAEALVRLALTALNVIRNAVGNSAFTLDQIQLIASDAINRFKQDTQFLLKNACGSIENKK